MAEAKIGAFSVQQQSVACSLEARGPAHEQTCIQVPNNEYLGTKMDKVFWGCVQGNQKSLWRRSTLLANVIPSLSFLLLL